LLGPALLAVAALSHAMEGVGLPPWMEAMRFGLAAVAGVGMILAVPGAALLPVWCRVMRLGAEPGWFHLVLGAAMVSLLGHVVTHAALLLFGFKVTFWPMLVGSLISLLLAEVASTMWGGELRAPARTPLFRATLAGAVLLVLFTLVTSPPRFVGLGSYWSEELYTQIQNLNPGDTETPSPLSAGAGWKALGDGTHALEARTGSFTLRPVAGAPRRLCLVLQNMGAADLVVEVSLAGRRLTRAELISPVEVDFSRQRELRDPSMLILPALYDPSRQPRNSPPPLRMLVPTAEEGELSFTFRPMAGDGAVTVRLHDLSGRSAQGVRRAVESRFFVGDTGDIYETLELARGFGRHFFQYSSSYGGDRHDGGGYSSISDEPPGHHFLTFLALTLVQDQITGLSALHLGYLVLLWALGVHLAVRGSGSRLSPWLLLHLFGVLLIYTRLCRLGLESNAPDTLFLLLLLAGMAALLDGRSWLASALVAVAFWVHVPAPHATVILGVSAVALLGPVGAARFTVRTLCLLAMVLLARYLSIAMAAGLEQAWHTGQAVFLANNRSGMVREILLNGRMDLVPTLAGVAGEWALLLLAGSAGAALFFLVSLPMPARKDAETWVIFGFGFLFFLATALLDLHRPHHVGPVAIPLAAALTRRIAALRSDGARRIILGLSVAAAAAALIFFLFYAGPDPTDTLNPTHLGDFAHMPPEY